MWFGLESLETILEKRLCVVYVLRSCKLYERITEEEHEKYRSNMSF